MVTILKKGADKKAIRKVIQTVENAQPVKRGLEAAKYSGTVKFEEDGLTYQKRVRDEWE